METLPLQMSIQPVLNFFLLLALAYSFGIYV